MKKALSLILALVMLMSFSAVAFADGATTTLEDTETVDIIKAFNVDAPINAQTFNFKVEFDASSSSYDTTTYTLPDYTKTFSISFAAIESKSDNTASYTYTLPALNRTGTYVYKITEQVPASKVGGVEYDTTAVYMVITVLTDGTNFFRYVSLHEDSATGNKLGATDPAFTNAYKATSEDPQPNPDPENPDPSPNVTTSLSLKKEVGGNSGDKGKYFDFTVTFTLPEGTVAPHNVMITGGTDTSNPESASYVNGVATVSLKLKDNDTITFGSVPVGTSYAITESTPTDYTATATGFTKNTSAGSVNASVVVNEIHNEVITNTKEQEIPTGVSLDSLPYVIMLVTVAVAAMLIVLKKKANRA